MPASAPRSPDLGLRGAGAGIAIVRRRCLQLLSARSGRKPRHAAGIRVPGPGLHLLPALRRDPWAAPTGLR